MSTHTLSFMGVDPPEAFRCRIYGADPDDERDAFVRRLASHGVLDAPAYDGWTAALDRRGWVTASYERCKGGRHKRWRLSEAGRIELRRMGVLQ
ncbi:MAG: hypothetical protein GVY18_03630 [Bacteroidetes bacterium]|nr:hypothetical protein [Bacteroidota bacterium]